MADTSTLNISQYNPLQPFNVKQWDVFSPDDHQTQTDKINAIVQTLNRLGKLSNDVVTDWNKVMNWIMTTDLGDIVTNQLNTMGLDIDAGLFTDTPTTLNDLDGGTF